VCCRGSLPRWRPVAAASPARTRRTRRPTHSPCSRATLTERERRGLALFNDPARGNCAACHPSARGSDGSLPLFTDFSYDAPGVPRNAQLQQNADPGFFDLGLCARSPGDMAALSDSEVDDVIAFLHTLSDGYQP